MSIYNKLNSLASDKFSFSDDYVILPKFIGINILLYKGQIFYLNIEVSLDTFRDILDEALAALSHSCVVECSLINSSNDVEQTFHDFKYCINHGLQLKKNMFSLLPHNLTDFSKVEQLANYTYSVKDKTLSKRGEVLAQVDGGNKSFIFNLIKANEPAFILEHIVLYNFSHVVLYSQLKSYFFVLIKDIEWSLSFNNFLLPTIHFAEPVKYKNKSYTKCFGYTYEKIKEMCVGVGSIVKIEIQHFPVIKECLIKSCNFNLPAAFEVISSNIVYDREAENRSQLARFLRHFSKRIGQPKVGRSLFQSSFERLFQHEGLDDVQTQWVRELQSTLRNGVPINDLLSASPQETRRIRFLLSKNTLSIENNQLECKNTIDLTTSKNVNLFNAWISKLSELTEIKVV